MKKHHYTANSFYRNFIILLFCVIAFFPKITLIPIAGNHTGIRLDDLLVFVFFIVFLSRSFKNRFNQCRKIKKICTIFTFCLISFTISNIIGIALQNVKPILSFLYLMRALEYFVLIFAGIDLCRNSKKDDILFKLLKIAIIVHSVYAIFERFDLTPDISAIIGRLPNNRAYTTFSGPYELAGFLTVASAPFLYKIFFQRKYINLPYVVFALITILLSESRIALVALIIESTITLILSKIAQKKEKDRQNQKPHKAPRIILLTLGALILSLIIINSPLGTRFKNISFTEYTASTKCAFSKTDFDYYKSTRKLRYNACMANSTKDLSFSFRITKWATLITETIKTSPLFGLGMSISGEGMDGAYVRLLCETGIVGLCLWLTLLYIIYGSFPKKSEGRIIALLIIIALITNAIFIDIFDASKVMMTFWFIIGYYLCKQSQNNNYTKHPNPKIIHIVDGLNHGGVEQVLYNYYSHSKPQFSIKIVAHGDIAQSEVLRFNALGIQVSSVTPKRINPLKDFLELNKLIRLEQPTIIHVHMALSSYMALAAAWANGTPIRINHSHVAPSIPSKHIAVKQAVCNHFSNYRIACTTAAAKHAFGKMSPSAIILPNTFDATRFQFNAAQRKKIRQSLNVKRDDILLGNVGRCAPSKNQIFLLNILNDLHDPHYKLIIIGSGELEEYLHQQARKLGIENQVIFLQSTDSIQNFYSAMDIFVFPSISEGFGLALLEAQASGLPCVIAKDIPDDAIISSQCHKLSIQDGTTLWTREIQQLESYKTTKRRSDIKAFAQYNVTENKDRLNQIHQYTINSLHHHK